MKLKLLFTLFALLLTISISAQQADAVVANVNGKPIFQSELETAYRKNKIENQSLKDFTQSYIDYRLNVEEAFAQQLDTTSTYKFQYDTYRSQLIGPYLQNKDFESDYMHGLYNRMLEDVELKHVLLPFGKDNVFPSDTLAVYKKAIALRKTFQKKGFQRKDFIDNPSSANLPPDLELVNGYLGWLVPFMLSSTVEDAAYSLNVGSISMPIRSPKGYHLIQVLNRRPAAGYRNLEQVMFQYSVLPPSKQHADSVMAVAQKIYSEINREYNFQTLCDGFTEAYNTGEKGCHFDIIGLDAQLPPSFINTAFSLDKVGNISKPVASGYGVHILRLVGEIPIGSYENSKERLIERIAKTTRTFYYTDALQSHLLAKYNLSVNKDTYRKIADVANKIYPTDSLFTSYIKNGNEILFVVDDTLKFDVDGFSEYLYTQMEVTNDNSLESLENYFGQSVENPFLISTDRLDFHLKQYAIRKLYEYVNRTLEQRYPEFAQQMGEYADGILLFDVKNNNVWKKAQSDKEALNTYFNANRSKYKWDTPHYKGYIIHCANDGILKKAQKEVQKAKKGQDAKSVLKSVFDDAAIRIEKGLWAKDQNQFIDNKVFAGAKPASENDGFSTFFVSGKLIFSPEEMEDVKGLVSADYEVELEQKWMSSLREKYKVEINETVLKTIKDE